MPSGWDLQFSDSGLAFTSAFRNRLSLGQETVWARDLSDRAFAHVLAAVGGYCVRVLPDDDDPLPGISGPQASFGDVRISLERVRKIYREAVKTFGRRMVDPTRGTP